MNCFDVREQLLDLAYAEYSGADKAGLHEHLQSCRDCREALAGIHDLRELLSEAVSLDEDPWMPADAEAILESAQPRAPAGSRLRRTAAAWAAAALVLVAVLTIVQIDGRPDGLIVQWRFRAERAVSDPTPDLASLREDLQEQVQRTHELQALLQAVVGQLRHNERQQQESWLVLEQRIRRLKQRSDVRWKAVGRQFHGLQAQSIIREVTLESAQDGGAP